MSKEPGYIFGLGIIVRLASRLAAAIARLIARGKSVNLSAQERAALEALAAALDAWNALRPFPGEDNSPGTLG